MKQTCDKILDKKDSLKNDQLKELLADKKTILNNEW